MTQQTTNEVDIDFLREYKELFNEEWRTIVYYGGRGSGKSYHTALALLLRGRSKRMRILCTREIQKTIKDSVHKLLVDLIQKYNFGDYNITDKSIVNAKTGTEFIFSGLRHNVNEIKSLEGVDAVWVEEAQSISESSIKILVPTIRKPGSQIILTFNRLNELDPVYVRYVKNNPERTYVRKVNYDVLERAGLLSPELKLELEEDRKNPEVFAHIWLGEPLAQSEASILPRSGLLQAMERSVGGDGRRIVGVDVARMGADRTVFWERKGLKTTKHKVMQGLRTTQVCDALEEFVNFDKNAEIRVDDTGVGGGVTDEMMKRGYEVVAINFGGKAADDDKYPNWISEAWFHMRDIIDTIELPMLDDLLMELSTRQWQQDNKGKRRIESKEAYKKRGFRSPDLADACIICYAPVEVYEPNVRWL